MPPTSAGIVHQPPGQATLEYLPLEKVVIRAWIVDGASESMLPTHIPWIRPYKFLDFN